MSIKEYRDMYDHVRVSGERKSEILSEITGDGGMRQPEHKHSRLMMAAAIVAAALVVILPVGGYASRKLNAHFSYSVKVRRRIAQRYYIFTRNMGKRRDVIIPWSTPMELLWQSISGMSIPIIM